MKYFLTSLFTLLIAGIASALPTTHFYPQPGVKDYAPLFQKALDDFRLVGGGTLIIHPGNYPVHTGIFSPSDKAFLNITIKGIADSKGVLPLLYDTTLERPPHKFLFFSGNRDAPYNLTVNLSNLRFMGNNRPYSPNHPFYGGKAPSHDVITCLNIHKFSANNIIIKNQYGGGMLLGTGLFNIKDKTGRSDRPVVRNVQVLNCWNDDKTDSGGDGLMFWNVYNPTIENCIIKNDLDVTKGYARCGIVLEFNTEKAVIRNNYIAGYDRNIHIECDFGGHLIEGNTIAASYVGIIFSEDCGQDKSYKRYYSPNKVLNNTFIYNNDLERNNIVRNDWGFIYVYKASWMLDGLVIKDNTFKTTQKPPGNKPGFQKEHSMYLGIKKVYMRLDTQDKINMANNKFE